MSIYDDSMHATTIKKDTTDYVPQVFHNMKQFTNTIKTHSQRSNSYELPDMSSDDNDENGENDHNNEISDDNFLNEDGIDMDVDDNFNLQSLKQKKNQNTINLKRYSSKDIFTKENNNKNGNKSTNRNGNKCKQCCKQCNKNVYYKCCYSLPILHPHGNLRISWDCVIMIILIYTCVEIPYSLAFGIDLTLDDGWGVIALFIDCLLLFDVTLNFRTA
eukprot:362597_1